MKVELSDRQLSIIIHALRQREQDVLKQKAMFMTNTCKRDCDETLAEVSDLVQRLEYGRRYEDATK